ncbi:hypothetical protein [Mariprofundus ferrooxydans]|uniref:SAP domain-containing protein n=1 Tax=Mariprofundus ferrooxydans PV-1 TaxID=314345 RepID=Q0F1K6_9PROT|nr:hypothetical protein [Mariprofundus ferrooxydans]EAU55185.1 hypothetical protein SPV1_10651 [Mariprofundus ferrooxydans PV-1]
MHINIIRSKAKDMGLKTGRIGKIDLVHNIQRAEGNFDCFATAFDGICDQEGCMWQEECFALANKQRSGD